MHIYDNLNKTSTTSSSNLDVKKNMGTREVKKYN